MTRERRESELPAITICQPWAWAIVEGLKAVENRSWRTRYRGPLVIHAGKSRVWLERGAQLLESIGHAMPEDLAFGALVGIVDVVDVVPVASRPGDPFAFGPWCWVLENARAFEAPIPWAGAQSLWRVPRVAVPQAA